MSHIVKVKSARDNKTYAALLEASGTVKIFEDNFIKGHGTWDGQRIVDIEEQLGPDAETSAAIYKELEIGLRQTPAE